MGTALVVDSRQTASSLPRLVAKAVKAFGAVGNRNCLRTFPLSSMDVATTDCLRTSSPVCFTCILPSGSLLIDAERGKPMLDKRKKAALCVLVVLMVVAVAIGYSSAARTLNQPDGGVSQGDWHWGMIVGISCGFFLFAWWRVREPWLVAMACSWLAVLSANGLQLGFACFIVTLAFLNIALVPSLPVARRSRADDWLFRARPWLADAACATGDAMGPMGRGCRRGACCPPSSQGMGCGLLGGRARATSAGEPQAKGVYTGLVVTSWLDARERMLTQGGRRRLMAPSPSGRVSVRMHVLRLQWWRTRRRAT